MCTIKATKTISFNGSGKLYLFGRPESWSPSRLVWSKLSSICAELGVSEILAPKPKPEAPVDLVARRDTLTEVISVGGANVRRGLDAHVIRVEPGEAGFFATADCPCVIAKCSASGLAIMAHAGRRCLINEDSLLDDPTGYQHKSVVSTILQEFPDVKNIQVKVVCGIGAESFAHPADHPDHGELNSRRINRIITNWGSGCFSGEIMQGNLCLKTLIREQFSDPAFGHGLNEDSVEVDGVDTFSDKDDQGGFKWWSCRRDWKGDHQPSNAVLFVNS